ncbi:hypothetical protein PIROE2DRAFT_7285 [Piromyces sp. E2]|nr:hypothetical protein PIROE2DRAFT_7285 [Piromyces sp. E2]|eukprot:OUM65698.1 hypothetical protein PIROE2DRAFT_7285 [Piromyces sp. E2]
MFITLFTIIFCIFGVIQGAYSDIEIEKTGTIRRYAYSKNIAKWVKISSLIVTIVPMIFLLIISVIIAIKKKNFYMLIGGIMMFLSVGISGTAKEYSFFVSMFGEALLLICLCLFIQKEEKNSIII